MAKSQKEYELERLEIMRQEFPWYVDKFIDHEEEDLSHSSLLGYLYDLKIFFAWLLQEGIVQASQIKDIELSSLEALQVEHIMSFMKYLRKDKKVKMNNKESVIISGNKQGTINRKLSALKSLFHYLQNIAEDENRNPLLYRNVMLKVKVKSQRSSAEERAEAIEGKILTEDDEFDQFRDFVRDGFSLLPKVTKRQQIRHKENRERDTAIVSLILGSGLRVGEVASLTIDKLNLVDNMVRVVRKGRKEKEQIVRFSEQAKIDLEEYLAVRDTRYKAPENEKALFLTLHREPYGTPMSKRTMQAAVEKYAVAFGKPEMTVHKLRHSFATRYHRNNNDVPMLMRQLGHKQIETTIVYTHIGKEKMRTALEKMEG